MNIFYFNSKNFGDAVSKRFWREITGREITTNTVQSHYITIGSVMHFVKNNSIIFGTGFISQKGNNISAKPIEIISVRGPLTRDRLIKEFNLNCPKHYGDPLILMPCLYNKEIVITDNIIGILPHYVDKNNSNLKLLIHNLKNKGYTVNIIDIEVGDKYEDLINSINNCKYIISSSLHGVIMGIVYKKKTCFVEFSNSVIGGQFKFNDFFKSINIDFKYKKNYDSDILDNYIKVDYNILLNLGINLIKLMPFIDNQRKEELIKIYHNYYSNIK
jgi:pyruvyltransferase